MNEIIKIEERNGEQLVSGRELHDFLEVKTKYKDWFPRMCEYGFVENKDFIAIAQKRATAQGNESTYFNHLITISMAKEISMIQRNKKGKEAREYFIKCEEAWNSEEMVLARAMEIQNRKILTYKDKINLLEDKVQNLSEENEYQKQTISELKPIKEYVDTILESEDTMTITQIAFDYGLSGQALNKVLCEEKIIRNVGGQWILYKEYMNKGYTKSETIQVTKKDGTPKIIINTKWKQKGRLKIHELLTNLGIKANIDKEIA